MLPSVEFAGYRLSRLMLGTAQFGMPYGIANSAGQPSYEEVRSILACAVEAGVNGIDTAASYGTSEEVLGRALRDLGIADRMVIVTKVGAAPSPDETPAMAAERIRGSVTRSLCRLQLEALPVCLFHSEADFRHMDVLCDLKKQGLVRHVGVSAGAVPDAAWAILRSGRVEAMQIPTNILDPRYRRSGLPADARRRGVAIFVRSVFLQGLLLLPEERVPASLRVVVPVRRRLAALAREAGLGPAELAVRYVLGLEGVSCVLAGIESMAQCRENVAFFARGPLDAGLMQAAAAAVPDLPETVLTPFLWPKDESTAKSQ